MLYIEEYPIYKYNMSNEDNLTISVKLLTGELILFSVPKNEHHPPYRHLQRLIADDMKTNIETIRIRPMRERQEKRKEKPIATNFVAIVEIRPQIVLHIPDKLTDRFQIDFHELKHPTVIDWCNMNNVLDIHTKENKENKENTYDEDRLNIYIEYMCKKIIENKHMIFYNPVKIEGIEDFLSNPHPRAVRWILANIDQCFGNDSIFRNTNDVLVNELIRRIKNDDNFLYPRLSECGNDRLVDLLIGWFREQTEKKLGKYYFYSDLYRDFCDRFRELERGCQKNERLAQYVLTHPFFSKKMTFYQKLGIVARWPELNIKII